MNSVALGAALALVAGLLGMWEFAAIIDGHGGIPTISRTWQGIRDASPALAWIMGGLAFLLAAGVVLFAVWVLRHFRHDKRSTL